jgi:hypothetical protein
MNTDYSEDHLYDIRCTNPPGPSQGDIVLLIQALADKLQEKGDDVQGLTLVWNEDDYGHPYPTLSAFCYGHEELPLPNGPEDTRDMPSIDHAASDFGELPKESGILQVLDVESNGTSNGKDFSALLIKTVDQLKAFNAPRVYSVAISWRLDDDAKEVIGVKLVLAGGSQAS